ncbi:hypothetical protein ACO1PK_13580 [Alishewanella sp. d11]|uniref:hypothetical protein n=1 Tax=Alishewanella sp. d11 TaxID=3414030 RepID=UPI003BF7E16A
MGSELFNRLNYPENGVGANFLAIYLKLLIPNILQRLDRKLALTPFLLFLASCHSAPLDAVHREATTPVLSSPSHLQVELLAHLPAEINESSGLAKRHDILWTHNDSGNPATVFAMPASGGAITQRVNLKNAVNKDWEDLAQDDHTLYVADCGNNMGDRQWLQIYKVAWQDLDRADNEGSLPSQLMKVRLADIEPKPNLHAHNNDCEALTVVGEELWLFTKNWQDQNTRLYRIPKDSAVYEAKSDELFAANGLITGADFDPQTQRLALIGYRLGFLNVSAFIWIVPVADNAPLWDKASYHTISPAGQWEAILWHQGNLLVTREQSPLSSPWLGIIYL